MKNNETLKTAMDRRLSSLDSMPSCRPALMQRIVQDFGTHTTFTTTRYLRRTEFPAERYPDFVEASLLFRGPDAETVILERVP